MNNILPLFETSLFIPSSVIFLFEFALELFDKKRYDDIGCFCMQMGCFVYCLFTVKVYMFYFILK